MPKVNVKVHYAKGISVTIKNRSFREAMEIIWQSEILKEYNPLKLVFISTGKVLYMDKSYFLSYLDRNITQEELIELVECDELYRNKFEITIDNQTVDPGSLWKSVQNELYLIDSDNFLQTDFDPNKFEIA